MTSDCLRKDGEFMLYQKNDSYGWNFVGTRMENYVLAGIKAWANEIARCGRDEIF